VPCPAGTGAAVYRFRLRDSLCATGDGLPAGCAKYLSGRAADPGASIMKQFRMPDLGDGLQEAEVIEWHAKPGDTVEVDQLLVSVETAKAIVEVPSPRAGVVSRCFGAPGDLLHVGSPLVEFEGPAEDSGTVVGSLGQAAGHSDLAADDFIIGAAPSSRAARAVRAAPRAR